MFPITIQIETTTRCAAKCIMCPHDRVTRPDLMSIELIEKILNECAGKNVTIIPHQMGDLLADPRAIQILKMCKERGLRVLMSTPGIFLDAEKAQAMIEMGVDVINVSLDSLDKEIYENIRGLPFNKIMQNIDGLLQIKGRPNKSVMQRLVRSLNLLAMKYPLASSVARMADQVFNSSAEGVHSTQIWVSAVDMFFDKKSKRAFIKYWSPLVDHVQIGSFVQYPGVKLLSPRDYKSSKSMKCQRLSTDMIILSDGNVAKCCIDVDVVTSFGNISDQNISEIWNGPNRLDFISKLRSHGRENICPCNICNL